jgi:hypothetical protein
MGEDKRKEARERANDGVIYLHESVNVSQAAQNGLAFDISSSGACIYTHQEFNEGDSIKVFSQKFGDRPIKATVRWCRKVDDALFKVGLAFNREDVADPTGESTGPQPGDNTA